MTGRVTQNTQESQQQVQPVQPVPPVPPVPPAQPAQPNIRGRNVFYTRLHEIASRMHTDRMLQKIVFREATSILYTNHFAYRGLTPINVLVLALAFTQHMITIERDPLFPQLSLDSIVALAMTNLFIDGHPVQQNVCQSQLEVMKSDYALENSVLKRRALIQTKIDQFNVIKATFIQQPVPNADVFMMVILDNYLINNIVPREQEDECVLSACAAAYRIMTPNTPNTPILRNPDFERTYLAMGNLGMGIIASVRGRSNYPFAFFSSAHVSSNPLPAPAQPPQFNPGGQALAQRRFTISGLFAQAQQNQIESQQPLI